MKGLVDLCKAVELTDGNGEAVNNCFEGENLCREQKREEMLFFLAHMCEVIKKMDLEGECLSCCADIMVRILTNPCIHMSADSRENSQEVNECIETLRNNEKCRSVAQKFVSDMNDELSVLSRLYEQAINRKDFERKYADVLLNIAKQFDDALKELQKAMSQGRYIIDDRKNSDISN